MIRNASLAILARIGRGAVKATRRLLAAAAAALPWPVARGALRSAGSILETAVEYGLYLVGWPLWALDWLPRALVLLTARTRAPRAGRLRVHGVLLLQPGGDPAASLARGARILDEAALLLARHGLEVVAVGWSVLPFDARLRFPDCGPSGLLARSFTWLSARAPARAPTLTVFFAHDLGTLAGCAFPGADWILVDRSTDGTTIVHELGHLADLWRHSIDPDNVMTDRAGGTHDRISAPQRALLRTCRFVSAAPIPTRTARAEEDPRGPF